MMKNWNDITPLGTVRNPLDGIYKYNDDVVEIYLLTVERDHNLLEKLQNSMCGVWIHH